MALKMKMAVALLIGKNLNKLFLWALCFLCVTGLLGGITGRVSADDGSGVTPVATSTPDASQPDPAITQTPEPSLTDTAPAPSETPQAAQEQPDIVPTATPEQNTDTPTNTPAATEVQPEIVLIPVTGQDLLSQPANKKDVYSAPDSSKFGSAQDPYFIRLGQTYYFRLDCTGYDNCVQSDAPISAAIDNTSSQGLPDDGVINVEGGHFSESIQISTLPGPLTIRGKVDGQATYLDGGLTITGNSAPITFLDFVFNGGVSLVNAGQVTFQGSTFNGDFQADQTQGLTLNQDDANADMAVTGSAGVVIDSSRFNKKLILSTINDFSITKSRFQDEVLIGQSTNGLISQTIFSKGIAIDGSDVTIISSALDNQSVDLTLGNKKGQVDVSAEAGAMMAFLRVTGQSEQQNMSLSNGEVKLGEGKLLFNPLAVQLLALILKSNQSATILVNGPMALNGSLSIEAPNILVNGPIQATDITLNGQQAVAVMGDIRVETRVMITSGTILDVEGLVESKKSDVYLSSGDGIILHKNAHVIAAGQVLIDADLDQDGIGTYTQQAGAVVEGKAGIIIRAADIVLLGSLLAGEAPVQLIPSQVEQAVNIGDILAGGFNISLEELKNIHTRGAVTIGADNSRGAVSIGSLDLSSSGLINLNVFGGNIAVNSLILAFSGMLRLMATGYVTSSNLGKNNISIPGGSLLVKAQGFGTATAPIRTAVDVFSALVNCIGSMYVSDLNICGLPGEGRGGIYMKNNGDLTIGGQNGTTGLTSGGEIIISAPGKITTAAPVNAAGKVRLTANAIATPAAIQAQVLELVIVPDPYLTSDSTSNSNLSNQAIINEASLDDGKKPLEPDPRFCSSGTPNGGTCSPQRGTISAALADAILAGTIYLEDGMTFSETIDLSGRATALTFSGGWNFTTNVQGTTSTLNAPINITNTSGVITFVNIIFGSNALITLNNSDNVTITGTSGADALKLSLVGTNPVGLTLDGGNGVDSLDVTGDLSGGNFKLTASNMETVTIKNTDAVTLGRNILIGGADLVVKADTITVNAGVIISTRSIANTAGGNHLTDPSNGDSGSIELIGKVITTNNNDKLLAQVETGSTYHAGDISIVAAAEVISFLYNLYSKPSLSIMIGTNNVLKGENISLTAEVSNNDPLKPNAQAWVLSLIEPLTNLLGDLISLPVMVMVKDSSAIIDVGQGTAITANGGVDIEAIASAEAKTRAVSRYISFGWADANATAKVTVNSGVNITAKGSVYILANGSSEAEMISRTSANLGTPGPNVSIGISAAVARANLTVLAEIKQGATIISTGGNINVNAIGAITSTAEAEVGVFDDGKAGLSVALGLTNSSVKSLVDGTLMAAGVAVVGEFNPGSTVNLTNNTIHFDSPHGFLNGQPVVYNMGDDGKAIDGLKDGETYYVIYVDAQTIKLSKGPALDLSYVINPDIFQALTLDLSLSFDPSALVNDKINFGTLHGLSTGDAVIYRPADDRWIANLTPGQTYYVIKISDTEIKLALSAADAASGTALTIGDLVPFQDHTLSPKQLFNPASAVSSSTITLPAHGWSNGQRVVYNANGSPIAGLGNGSIYYIVNSSTDTLQLSTIPGGTAIVLDNSAATGTAHSLCLAQGGLFFDPETALDDAIDSITFSGGHNLTTGQQVVYRKGDHRIVSGLQDGETYYVIVVDANTVKLASTAADAQTPYLPVDLKYDVPTANSFLDVQKNASFIPKTAVNSLTDEITFSAPHGFADDQKVIYHFSGGAPIGNLTDGASYYVIYSDADTIKLSDTLNGTPIDLTYSATDSSHSFQPEHNVSFDPVNTIDVATGYFNYAGTNHGYTEGQSVVYQSNGFTALTGLTDSATYTIHVVDVTHFQLKSAGVLVSFSGLDLTPFIGTTHALNLVTTPLTFDPDIALNSQKDTITFTAPHNLVTGAEVRYQASDNRIIDGLSRGELYAVYVVDAYTIQLSDSRRSAMTELPEIDLTDRGLGSAHSLDANRVAGIGILASLANSATSAATSGIGGEPGVTDKFFKGEVLGATLFNLIKSKMSTTTDASPEAGKAGATNSPSSAVGALGLVITNDDVLSQVGSHAVLKSNMDLAVAAEDEVKPQGSANTSIEKPEDSTKPNALGLAVTIILTDTNIRSEIAGSAQADASGSLDVTSTLDYPMIKTPKEAFDTINPLSLGSETISPSFSLDDMLGGDLGLQAAFLNTFSCSVAEADDLSVAASFVFLKYNNIVDALIGNGALINQDVAYRDAGQTVNVAASTSIITINMAGIFKLGLGADGLKDFFEKDKTTGKRSYDLTKLFQPFGVQSEKGGIGGSILLVLLNNNTHAWIEPNAKIHSGPDGGLTVNAATDVLSIPLAQAGASAKKYSIGGSFTFDKQDNVTLAEIQSGVTIEGGPISVTAEDTNTRVNVVGTVVKGESLGVGVSVAVNLLNRDTQARIGAPDGSAADSGETTSILSSGAITVSAVNKGVLVAIALAAAKISNQPAPESPESAGGSSVGDPAAAVTPTSSAPTGGSGAGGAGAASSTETTPRSEYGIGISGDVSINLLEDDALAYINDCGVIMGQAVSVTANNQTSVWAVSGSAAISTSDKKSIGIAGSVSVITITGRTLAYIKGLATDHTNVGATTLDVEATRSGLIRSLTAGGAGSKGPTSAAVAGSVAVNTVTDTISAYLKYVTASVDNLIVKAEDTSQIDAMALSAGVSLADGSGGTGGSTIAIAVGVSVAFNQINSTLAASIENSEITSTQAGIEVLATSGMTIRTLSVAAAIAADAGASGAAGGGNSYKFSGGGAESTNSILGSTSAAIQNSIISSAGDVTLAANNTSTIETVVIGVSGTVSWGGGAEPAPLFRSVRQWRSIASVGRRAEPSSL